MSPIAVFLTGIIISVACSFAVVRYLGRSLEKCWSICGWHRAANVAFGGLALSVFGVLLILIARDLGKWKHLAWRMGVPLFCVLGGVIAGPLLVWHREFLAE